MRSLYVLFLLLWNGLKKLFLSPLLNIILLPISAAVMIAWSSRDVLHSLHNSGIHFLRSLWCYAVDAFIIVLFGIVLLCFLTGAATSFRARSDTEKVRRGFKTADKQLDTSTIRMIFRSTDKNANTIRDFFSPDISKERWDQHLSDILWSLESHMREDDILTVGRKGNIIRLITGPGVKAKELEHTPDPMFMKKGKK